MSCVDDDSGASKCEKTEFRVARKNHKCSGCGERIERGHRYRVESGVWDWGPNRFKYCLRCSALIDAILDKGEGFIHEFGCGHDWWDVFGEDPPEEVASLAFVTAQEMQDRIKR